MLGINGVSISLIQINMINPLTKCFLIFFISSHAAGISNDHIVLIVWGRYKSTGAEQFGSVLPGSPFTRLIQIISQQLWDVSTEIPSESLKRWCFAMFWHVQGPQTSTPRAFRSGHSRGTRGSTALNQSPTEHRKAKYYSNFHSWLIFLAFCCSHTLMQFTIYICKSHTSLQKELCTMNMPIIQ